MTGESFLFLLLEDVVICETALFPLGNKALEAEMRNELGGARRRWKGKDLVVRCRFVNHAKMVACHDVVPFARLKGHACVVSHALSTLAAFASTRRSGPPRLSPVVSMHLKQIKGGFSLNHEKCCSGSEMLSIVEVIAEVT